MGVGRVENQFLLETAVVDFMPRVITDSKTCPVKRTCSRAGKGPAAAQLGRGGHGREGKGVQMLEHLESTRNSGYPQIL